MEHHVLGLVTAIALVLAGGPARAADFWDPLVQGRSAEAEAAARALAGRLVSSMSDEELLGQVCMFGYLGTEPSEAIVKWITEKRIGGVKIFTRNVDGLDSLSAGIRRMQRLSQASGAKVPLFISTDQEGGWVRHIKCQTSVSAGNLAIGASRLPRDAYLTGYYLGRELASLGINMNFAPTADVYANPEASVIGPRSFGSDPRETGLLSAAYVQGMRKAGILCTAKHFPGHGSADQDSHGRLPVVTDSLLTLQSRDLVPYRILAKEEVPAIMSAHLAFPSILGDLTPSSLSPFFMRTVLRDQIGFGGIVITDDMEMEGVLAGGIDTPTACRLAIEAGNDMILISHTPLTEVKTWSVLLKAMQTSPAFHKAVEGSAQRILETKLCFFRGIGKNGRPLADADSLGLSGRLAGLGALSGRAGGGSGAPSDQAGSGSAPAAGSDAPAARPSSVSDAAGLLFDLTVPVPAALPIPAPGAADFFFQSSCRSVSVVAGKGIPFKPAPSRKVLLCGQFEEFIQEGALRYPDADTLLYPFTPFYSPRSEDLERIPKTAARYDAIVFCLSNFNSLEVLKRMKDMAGKILVISALTPVYLSEVPWVETAVAVYGSGTDSFRAGFAALAGDYAPRAALPVWFGSAEKK
jgi:beta-glucosidase-like glycosyl hydrolase